MVQDDGHHLWCGTHRKMVTQTVWSDQHTPIEPKRVCKWYRSCLAGVEEDVQAFDPEGSELALPRRHISPEDLRRTRVWVPKKHPTSGPLTFRPVAGHWDLSSRSLLLRAEVWRSDRTEPTNLMKTTGGISLSQTSGPIILGPPEDSLSPPY